MVEVVVDTPKKKAVKKAKNKSMQASEKKEDK